jgi:hypothetical protein
LRACQAAIETDCEENHLLLRIRAGDFQAIERRIDDANVRAAGLEQQQVAIRAGHAQHIAEGTEDHIRSLRDSVRFINHLKRGDADGAPGAMDEFDFRRQEIINAVFDDAVGLAAAHFHQDPGAGDRAADFFHHLFHLLRVAIFVEVFHGGGATSVGSGGAQSSSSASLGLAMITQSWISALRRWFNLASFE